MNSNIFFIKIIQNYYRKLKKLFVKIMKEKTTKEQQRAKEQQPRKREQQQRARGPKSGKRQNRKIEKDEKNPTNEFVCARASRDLVAGEELCFKYHHEGELLHYLFYYLHQAYIGLLVCIWVKWELIPLKNL